MLPSDAKELDPNEISEIMDEVGKSHMVKSDCIKSLSCCRLCGWSERVERFRKKASTQIEEQLDIRNIVSAHTSVSQLLNLLLSKQQRLLFAL